MHENHKPHSLVKPQNRKLKRKFSQNRIKNNAKTASLQTLMPPSSKLQMLHFLSTAEWLHTKMERNLSELETEYLV